MFNAVQTTGAQARLPLTTAPVTQGARLDGQIAWLLSHDDALARLRNGEIATRFVRPIRNRSGQLWCRGAIPVGLAVWARLNRAAEAALLGGVPVGQKHGPERLWLTDLVAPFGDKAQMLRSLRREIFPSDEFLIALRGDDGSVAQVVTCHGQERVV